MLFSSSFSIYSIRIPHDVYATVLIPWPIFLGLPSPSLPRMPVQKSSAGAAAAWTRELPFFFVLPGFPPRKITWFHKVSVRYDCVFTSKICSIFVDRSHRFSYQCFLQLGMSRQIPSCGVISYECECPLKFTYTYIHANVDGHVDRCILKVMVHARLYFM